MPIQLCGLLTPVLALSTLTTELIWSRKQLALQIAIGHFNTRASPFAEHCSVAQTMISPTCRAHGRVLTHTEL